MVHMCTRIIFLGIFLHFFQILIFRVNSGVKVQKMTQNDKTLSVALHILGSTDHMILIFDAKV